MGVGGVMCVCVGVGVWGGEERGGEEGGAEGARARTRPPVNTRTPTRAQTHAHTDAHLSLGAGLREHNEEGCGRGGVCAQVE